MSSEKPVTSGNELKQPLTRKDFLSQVDPRWCPGCGDYAVFKNLTAVYADMGVPREKFTIISGIGCSSRLPYYTETYGFHSIHGRAPAIALGAKIANPDLNVWVITGDGDALSIGGNHFLHTIRRNPDIKIVLFNNQIYGLTKGQASPTSPLGIKTKTTPLGSVDVPVRPMTLAVAAGATFAARVLDTDQVMLKEVLQAAANHRGVAVIEILVNCVIFNDGAFASFTNKETSADHVVRLRHGEPLVFGKDSDKVIMMAGATPRVVSRADNVDNTLTPLTHDLTADSSFAYMLASLEHPQYPMPVGVFRCVAAPTYEDALREQASHSASIYGSDSTTDERLDAYLQSGETWKIP